MTMTAHRLAFALATVSFALAPLPLRADVAGDARELAARIDTLIAARWPADVRPAPRSSDGEYLRRVYLDLLGRIPSVAEARDFLDDPSPDKRERLVDDLLGRPEHARHFANVWRRWLLGPTAAESTGRARELEAWLRQRLEAGAGYDRVVSDLLTAPAAFRPPGDTSDPTPLAFYEANRFRPANLAGSTARLFLGVKLECAQCHDHPSGRWARTQFWQFAASFAGLEPPEGAPAPWREQADRRELTIPGTRRVVLARTLDGKDLIPSRRGGTRHALARWATDPGNPYFARAAVNRFWAYFFGTGLAEPAEDLTDPATVCHPELLDALAVSFAGHGFDGKFLVRALTASVAYQRGSAATHPIQNDPRRFARMAVRGLSPEQLWDSLVQATGYRPNEVPEHDPAGRQDASPRAELLARLADADRPAEAATLVPQALVLMNGRFMGHATSVRGGGTLAVVACTAGDDPARGVETLFLAALSRRPSLEERDSLVGYVRDGGAGRDPDAAWADVFWALLNSPEFAVNH
jgi:hypothetical protein